MYASKVHIVATTYVSEVSYARVKDINFKLVKKLKDKMPVLRDYQ